MLSGKIPFDDIAECDMYESITSGSYMRTACQQLIDCTDDNSRIELLQLCSRCIDPQVLIRPDSKSIISDLEQIILK